MKPTAIPDVLFLRPNANESTSAPTSESSISTVERARKSESAAKSSHSSGPASNDVVFAAASTANPSDSATVPTPHTQFAKRNNQSTTSSSITEIPEESSIDPAPIDSSSVLRSPFREMQAPVKVQPVVEPSWMVNQFQWNPITDQLIETNAEDLARLIREIQQPATKTTVLGVLGLEERVGTTTVAQLCARLLDEAEHSTIQPPFGESSLPTLLLDANMHHPAIGHQVGLRCRRCWADLQEQKDSLGDAVIANSENRIHVMPLNCSLQEDALDRSNFDRPNLQSGYSIPATGLPGMISRMNNVIAHATQCYRNIIVDLGTAEAWQSRSGLQPVASQLNHVLLVNATPLDRRQFSRVYWELNDCGVGEIHLLENPIIPENTKQ